MFSAVILPVFLSIMFIPYWTRKTESFGVSIPEEVYERTELQTMRKKYSVSMGAAGIVAVVGYFAAGILMQGDENTFSLLLSAILVLYILISFIVYLRFHKQMKVMKANENWSHGKSQQVVVDTSFRTQRLTYSNGWFFIAFAISLVTLVLTFQFYDRIPERFPMQYSFNGEVTNWADKSYRTVLLMPVMQFYLAALFLFINSMIGRAKQQVSAENPEESKYRNLVFRRRWSAFIIITGIGITVLFALIQLSFIYDIDERLLIILPILFGIAVTIGTVVLSFTTGQGGSRVQTTTDKKGEVIDRDDDRYWKLGQFYINKNDPALFLEKRFGIGWTINLASPFAWLILITIILLAVGLPLLLGA
ncbi:hypothetical protein LD39_04265 [Halobacillus sp. BBL2006]|nr:hypothetical protein LD39_04265 [Halobacillus sp. BBL2006]